MRRLIPFSGLTDEKWEVFVIDDPSMSIPPCTTVQKKKKKEKKGKKKEKKKGG